MPDLDRDLFNKRLKLLYQYWQNTKSTTENVDAICVVTGADSESSYYKTIAVQQWLFGIEITDSMIIFCDKYVIFVASPKKLAFFKQIEGGKENDNGLPKYKFITRDKNDTEKVFLKETLDLIRKSKNGKTIGIFSKDKYDGEFIKDWTQAIEQAKFEKVDISTMIANILAVKDDQEMQLIKKACEITTKVFGKYLKDQIINIIDGEKKVKHAKLSEGVEQAINDSKYVPQSESQFTEICYPAIIQSGGNYNLKFSAISDKNNLHYGTIICALGVRYKNYCSNIVRTMLVDPSDKIQSNYNYLLTLEDELINNLYDGVKLCDVYDKIRAKVQNEKPDLVDKLTSNFGFAIGIEFREPTYLITNKCTAIAKKGMTFQISIGLSDLKNDDAKDEESKKCSLFVGDTIVVNAANEPASVLTTSKKKIEHIGIFLKDGEEDEEEEEEEEEEKSNKKKGNDKQSMLPRSTRSAILQTKTRSDNNQEHHRSKHLKELSARLNEEAKERILSQKGQVSKEKVRKAAVSYKNQAQLPFKHSEVEELKIYVDKGHETVILPIFGQPVPFHVSTIKNLSTSVEGDFTYLRINFSHPGIVVNKTGGGEQQSIQDVYIKEITYRATNVKELGEISAPSTNLNLAFKYIKDAQKEFKEKEHEEKEKEGMVKQDNLVLSTNKANPKLKDLYLKPNTVQRRIPGTLEAHTNGFLYTSNNGDKIEILYNNIKHAVFQPCDNEIIILVHFHLKNAIMFGKKKNNDIQFYRDVGETITDLGKHKGGDRDDIIAEQGERELRKKLNLAFKSFIEKVESMSNNQVTFELPFRELAFNGTPYRSMVLLQPTSSCLINVTEMPSFILTLDEIELVHFERVGFHLKNFDMVFVFKDYTRKVSMVTSIPMNQLDQIKEWLTSCDIYYTEGIQNLNWPKIMKTINDDPEGFFDNGGWTFLDADGSESGDEQGGGGGGGDEISDEEDDAYEPSDDDGSNDEESDYTESDEEDEYVDSDDESGSEEMESDEESGKSWSELEEEARREDEQHDSDGSDRDSRKRKKPTEQKNTNAKRSRK